MKRTKYQLITLTLLALTLSGCSTTRALLGMNSSDRMRPIGNPFYAYSPKNSGDPGQNMILRTKKGDRSIELEIPGNAEKLSDFVLPMSPSFKDNTRGIASVDPASPVKEVEENSKPRNPSLSDREIINSFPQGNKEIDNKRKALESQLKLTPAEEDLDLGNAPSYLGSLDHVKQLYRAGRYEAALLETDDLIKTYQLDPKLYEMRGTLLDRLGKRELAIKSWNQSLKLDPKNQALKKFVERKQLQMPVGSQ